MITRESTPWKRESILSIKIEKSVEELKQEFMLASKCSS